MEFLVISKPKAEFITGQMPADFAAIDVEESAHAKPLYVPGSLRRVWALVRKGRGAAVIFEADSPKQMEEIFSGFPLVKADYVDYRINQLGPCPAFGK